MSPAERHYADEIQDLLDGRLAESLRAEVEAHLASCAECRGIFTSVRSTKELLARTARSEAGTPGIEALLDEEERREKRRGGLVPLLRWGAAAVVLVALALTFVWYGRRESLPDRVARDFADYRAGTLELPLQTTKPEELERLFAQQGITFETRVFDLGMMGYQVAGGRVHTLLRRPTALFVYRDAKGRVLICQMFEGRLEELTAPEETRLHNGILFHMYRRGGTTLVFWQEGPVVCVLVSDIPTEEVVLLAFAKAMRI